MAGKKRFHPCGGYYLKGAVKWIYILNIVITCVGLGLVVTDIWQLWDQWILEKRENFAAKWRVAISFAVHMLASFPIDIYFVKVNCSSSTNTNGLVFWIVVTFLNTLWIGILYHFSIIQIYYGLHVIYNLLYGYFLYRVYTLIVVCYYIKEIKCNETDEKIYFDQTHCDVYR